MYALWYIYLFLSRESGVPAISLTSTLTINKQLIIQGPVTINCAVTTVDCLQVTGNNFTSVDDAPICNRYTTLTVGIAISAGCLL